MRSLPELFSALRDVAWFSKCGSATKLGVQVKSWNDAGQYYRGRSGIAWENFKNSVSNRQSAFIWEITQDAREDHQKRARQANAMVTSFFDERSDRIFGLCPKDGGELERMVKLDLNWIAGEVEFVSCAKVLFFSSFILPVYLAGHLPCGWRGKRMPEKWSGNSLKELPEGSLVVF